MFSKTIAIIFLAAGTLAHLSLVGHISVLMCGSPVWFGASAAPIPAGCISGPVKHGGCIEARESLDALIS